MRLMRSENDSQNKKKEIPHFVQLDPKAYDEYFGGIDPKISTQIYTKTAEIFLKNIEERYSSLSANLASNQNQPAIVTAHQLKGSLLSLGGPLLANIFRHIELGVNRTPNEELLATLKESRANLDLFISELKTWIAFLRS